MEDLGNYLGMPSLFSRNKSKDFGYIVNKVSKVLQWWKKSFFSIAGKEILIKSVGQAIPTYAMSMFKFPKGLCDEITRCFSQFWWGSSEEKKKIHWCKLSKLCLPKCLGGMNFRDLRGFNQALIAKQVWRLLIHPNSLAARFLASKYYWNDNILDANLGRKPSFLWRSLLWGRELLNLGLRFRVGNGRNISMFSDPWIPKESLFKPRCINESVAQEKVSFFITVSGA